MTYEVIGSRANWLVLMQHFNFVLVHEPRVIIMDGILSSLSESAPFLVTYWPYLFGVVAALLLASYFLPQAKEKSGNARYVSGKISRAAPFNRR